jgi:hypothetical protein
VAAPGIHAGAATAGGAYEMQLVNATAVMALSAYLA